MPIEPDRFLARRMAPLPLDEDDVPPNQVEEPSITRVNPDGIDLHIDGLCSYCMPHSRSWEYEVQSVRVLDIFLQGLEFPETDAAVSETNKNSAGLSVFIDLVDRFSGMKSAGWSSLCSRIERFLSFPRRHMLCGEAGPHVLKRVADLRQILNIPLSYEDADVELVHRYDRLLPSQQAAVNQAVLAAGPKVDLNFTFANSLPNQEQHPTEIFLTAIADITTYNQNHRASLSKQLGVIDRLRAMVQKLRIERFLRDPDFMNQTADSLYLLFGVEITPADPALATFIRLPREQQQMVKGRIHRARWNALNTELSEKIPCPFDTRRGSGVTLDPTN